MMVIILIILYFLPMIVVAGMDQAVTNGMLILTVAVIPIINIIASTREDTLGLWILWTIIYYCIAVTMVMTKLGYPVGE